MYNVRKSWCAHKLKLFPLKFDVSVGLETTKPNAVGQTQRAQKANFAVSKFLGVTATNGLNKNLQNASLRDVQTRLGGPGWEKSEFWR